MPHYYIRTPVVRSAYHARFVDCGGSSYIDAVILRDRDMNSAWTAASDGSMESRHYYCQNWRGDVSVIVDDNGDMCEWIKYSAYGIPFTLPAGDTDSDGDWDSADSSAMGDGGTYDVRQDADLDGDNDGDDATYTTSLHGGTSLVLGRGVLTSSKIVNRKGYAGYEYAPEFAGAGRTIYHVRHRAFLADLAQWSRRDPLGYVDGLDLYSYVQALAIVAADPMGLALCDIDGARMYRPDYECKAANNATRGSSSPSPPQYQFHSFPNTGGPPPLCAGGTCSTPTVPGPSGPGGFNPWVCSGGNCQIPGPVPSVFDGMCQVGGGPGTTRPTPPSRPGQTVQPGHRRPRLDEGDPGYWDGPPDCRNPTWCYQKFLQRTSQNLGAMDCFMNAAATTWGPATFACLVGCGVFAALPEPGATKLMWAGCVTACGVDVATVLALAADCISRKRFNQENAENSYCGCLAWKRGHCEGTPGHMREEGPLKDIKCSGKYGWPGFDE